MTGFPTSPTFPSTRMRRNRSADWLRRMVQENRLTADDLIWPDRIGSPEVLDQFDLKGRNPL